VWSLTEWFTHTPLQGHISFGALEQCGLVHLLMPPPITVSKAASLSELKVECEDKDE